MELHLASDADKLYAGKQSTQISCQTGYVGQKNAWFAEALDEISGEFIEFDKGKETEEFSNDMREALKGLVAVKHQMEDTALGKTIRAEHPECKFGSDGEEFVLRMDTDKYVYIASVSPDWQKAYISCYERQYLDQHVKEAEHGVRFITPDYKPLFTMPDGGTVKVTRFDGEQNNYTCRYIDDYHMELNNHWSNLYHICQLAEAMEKTGATVEPVTPTLEELRAAEQSQVQASPKAQNQGMVQTMG